MHQIIKSKDTDSWKIAETSDLFLEPEEIFHGYRFETKEEARGVYIHHALRKTKGFTLEYIKETKQTY